MNIQKNSERTKEEGWGDHFTGHVSLEMLLRPEDPARAAAASVTFEAGARTAWHTHPHGQTLFITDGTGWVQSEGKPRQEVRSGDVVHFAPGERHWHGASASSSMTHLAVQESENGRMVDWQEQVTDAEYLGG